MYFLDISAACTDPGLATILSIFRKIFNVIEVVAPIALLVMVVVHLINMMTNPDDKKGLGKLKNSILACVIIFFIPTFINVTMYLIGDSTGFSACWNSNPSTFNTDNNYTDNDSSNNGSLYNNPSDYQGGEKDSTSSVYEIINNKKDSTIFIGDSRTVQMYSYLSDNWNGANYTDGGVHIVDNDIFIAEGSMGLSWMKNTAIPVANDYFSNNSSIVIMMGVNDLGNVDKYIKYINQNISLWKKNNKNIYFVSVTPCDGAYEHLNHKIESFNVKMKLNLSKDVKYIEVYSYLKNNGFDTVDGLHYTKDTYQTIYNYIKSKM